MSWRASSFLDYALSMSVIAAAFLILLPLLVRRYRTGWLYAASIILLVGFLIPVRPEVRLPAKGDIVRFGDTRQSVPGDQPTENHGPDEGYPLSTGNLPISFEKPEAEQPQEAVFTEKKSGQPWPLADILVALWLIGAAVYGFMSLRRHLRRLRIMQRFSHPITDSSLLSIFDEVKEAMGIRRNIRFLYLPFCTSPALVGLFRPAILVNDLTLNEDELRLLLRHEMTHFRRGDIFVNIITLLAASLHWYNPIVHLLARAGNALCEISCDESVAAKIDHSQRVRYGHLLIKSVRPVRGITHFSPSFMGGKYIMKKRLQAIFNNHRRTAGLLVILLTLTAMLSASVVYGESEEEIRLYTIGASYADWDLLTGLGAFQKSNDDYVYEGIPIGLVFDEGPSGEFRLLVRTGFIADKPVLEVQRNQDGEAVGFTHVSQTAAEEQIRDNGYWLAPSAWYKTALFAKGNAALDLKTLTALDPSFQATESGYTYRGDPVDASVYDSDVTITLSNDYSSHRFTPLGFSWNGDGVIHEIRQIPPEELGAFIQQEAFGIIYDDVSNHGQDFAVWWEEDEREPLNEIFSQWFRSEQFHFSGVMTPSGEWLDLAGKDLVTIDSAAGTIRINLTLPSELKYSMHTEVCLHRDGLCLGTLCDLGIIEPGAPLGSSAMLYVPTPGFYEMNLDFSLDVPEMEIPILYGCSLGFPIEVQ